MTTQDSGIRVPVLSKYARPSDDLSKQPPKLDVRYFYASPLQIDDPLAPVPHPTSNPAAENHPLRPFSDRDNDALDKAWRDLQLDLAKFKQKTKSIESGAKTARKSIRSPLRGGFLGDVVRSRSNSSRPQSRQEDPNAWKQPVRHGKRLSNEAVSQSLSSVDGLQEETEKFKVGSPRSHAMERALSEHSDFDTDSQGLTGMPFIRAPSRKKVPSLRPNTPTPSDSRDVSDGEYENAEEKVKEPSISIPVGISRLHQVSIPKLRMEPIYWRPVHDEFDIVRATWFYKDSMLPVEVDVANMLEKGYVELRPWTETWNDELNSAVEVGAAGEEKVAHVLWPERVLVKSRARARTESISGTEAVDEETLEARRQSILKDAISTIDKSTDGSKADNKAAESATFNDSNRQKKLFRQSTVIYLNAKEAVILRSNLSPSAYHKRRPYASSIRNGIKIGVTVTRGFDKTAVNRFNGGKHASLLTMPPPNDHVRQSEWQSFPNIGINPTLPTPETAHVTDLVLVIHGIGQKLSERVESFNFTHAMNSFRRDVNVERCDSVVMPHLRKDTGGIMVLPVNWRSTLSFEDEPYLSDVEDDLNSFFTLQDITPKSLPSVRNIISDVMLDIPYYLSHHQPRMISAVIREANRIYRLWCTNNPGFDKSGRVHLIAHSLGSVMALDILSRQPNSVDTIRSEHSSTTEPGPFAFDTKNLFLCGSPAGFFLLLKKARLLPRKDQGKAGSEGDDLTPGVASTRDTYGCLAVDNIYNIVNPYDPVAYQLNATIDPAYAASLKPAIVPSASSSWFRFGRGFTSNAYGLSKPKNPRLALGTRLPSNVELETHNFTREEIAEKRAYLLNDNGQIDYFLKYGGGPLEIQYLTMLGAHSSYWLAKDFVRMLVLEVGRTPGKDGTLEALRAAKKKSLLV